MGILEQVNQTVVSHRMLEPGTVVVGVSGGADSVALLHILLRLAPEFEASLIVAHLNHQLRGEEAVGDATFVEALAVDWGLPVVVETADVTALARERRLATEEAARQARYAFLLRVARQAGAHSVAVAHHADDQAETVLMHFLRGSGLAGLRGILPVSDLRRLRLGSDVASGEPVRLIRPLIDVSKQDILDYCERHGLGYRFDRSNLDQTYFRNRLRYELLPLLETYNPNVREVLQRTANLARDDHAFLQAKLRKAWDEVLTEKGHGWLAFDLAAWRRLPVSLQRGVIRESIRRLRRGLRNIDWIHVENAIEVLNEKETGSSVTLPQGLEATIAYERFYVAGASWTPPPDVPQLNGEAVPISVPGCTPLPDGRWSLHADLLTELPSDFEENPDPWQAWLDFAAAGPNLYMRPRQPGETIVPLGMAPQQKRVNEIMINAKIPAPWRQNWPLVSNAGQILWISGLRPDARAAVTAATREVLWLRFLHEGGR